MKKLSTLFAAGVMTLFFCGATSLQADTAPMLPHGTDKGEITAVNTNSHTFTLREGKKDISMSYDDKTQFVESGHAVQPTAMTKGEKAKVQFVEHEPGKPTATKVDLHPTHHS
ncbi:MAG TPA: hypothetical protein VMW38_21780 [Terriglobia bacterium]|nr:hypothetical protein [Terriglobia bacterium]